MHKIKNSILPWLLQLNAIIIEDITFFIYFFQLYQGLIDKY